jgi:hypothetical protein
MAQAYQSRWGYHPCDYATFLQLKELNQYYQRALRRFAAWKRWSRKQPQNRVIRSRRRNDQGQVIGKEVLGPRPEPALCPVFTRREEVRRYSSDPERQRKEERKIERVSMTHSDISEVYRKARKPVAREKLAIPLPYSGEEISHLLAECRAPSTS